MQQPNYNGIHKQQGIVLVVALLILMVMTVIGTSMLSSSTMEERMASNYQQKELTFQAADSCVNVAFSPNNPTDLVTLAVQNENQPQTQACSGTFAGGATTTNTSVTYTGVERYCSGFDVTTTTCVQLLVQSDSQIINTGATSQTIQTVYPPAPAL